MPEADINKSCEYTKYTLPLTKNEINYINKYHEFVKNNQLKPQSSFNQNLNAKLNEITQQQNEDTRSKVLNYIKQNESNLKISERFKKELLMDAYLRRYISQGNDTKKICKSIEFFSQIDNINDDNYPFELYEFGGNFACGFEKTGDAIIYLIVRRNFLPRKLSISIDKYCIYIMFQMVRIALATSGSFTVVVDFSEASTSNIDVYAARLLLKVLFEHAPHVVGKAILYNVHWAIRPLFNTLIAILPNYVKNFLYQCSSDEINKFISNDQLSDHLIGGLNSEILLGRPKRGVSFLDICHEVNLTKEEASKLIEQVKKSLKKNNCKLMDYE